MSFQYFTVYDGISPFILVNFNLTSAKTISHNQIKNSTRFCLYAIEEKSLYSESNSIHKYTLHSYLLYTILR
jgi:hypothetical protein